MEAQGGQVKDFSRCEACNAGIGRIKMDAPLYCISCIEEMSRLGIGPGKYKRYKVSASAASEIKRID